MEELKIPLVQVFRFDFSQTTLKKKKKLKQDVRELNISEVFQKGKTEFNRDILVYQQPEKAFCLGDYAAFGISSSHIFLFFFTSIDVQHQRNLSCFSILPLIPPHFLPKCSVG